MLSRTGDFDRGRRGINSSKWSTDKETETDEKKMNKK
jgi:hypothetical protein